MSISNYILYNDNLNYNNEITNPNRFLQMNRYQSSGQVETYSPHKAPLSIKKFNIFVQINPNSQITQQKLMKIKQIIVFRSDHHLSNQ